MGLTRTLAREGRYHGVQVNCALPWAVTDKSPDRSGEEFGPIIDAHMDSHRVALRPASISTPSARHMSANSARNRAGPHLPVVRATCL